MTITNTTRAVAAVLIALSLAVLLASGAWAGDVIEHDRLRDSRASAAMAAPDWARAGCGAAGQCVQAGPSWSRDPAAGVAPMRPLGDGLDWTDFGIGSTSSVAGLLLLAGLVSIALVTRRHHREHGV